MTCNCSEFQKSTAELQLLNKSILDIVTKLDEQTSMLNRAIFKSATHCGCIEIHATKQIYSPHKSLEENQKELDTHIEGELCRSRQSCGSQRYSSFHGGTPRS